MSDYPPPLISIVMPAYNAAMLIGASIESVLAQTYRHWELIVVNDGSKDDTVQVVEQYRDERIRLITQSNKRLGGARNTGISNARGEWIAFLDADDLWHAGKLEKQLAVAALHPEVSVIYTNGFIFHNDDLKHLIDYGTVTGYFTGEQMYRMEYAQNYIPVLSVLVKRDLVSRVGLQEEHLFYHGCEDWDYWLRMAKQKAVFLGMEERLFYYRKHTANMSSDTTSMRLAQMAVWIKNFDTNFFSTDEARHILLPVMDTLIPELIRKNKIREAQYLYRHTVQVIGEPRFRVNYWLIRCLGKLSAIPIRVVNKVWSIAS